MCEYFAIYGILHISCKFTINLQYLFYVNLHDNLHLCILAVTCTNIIESRAILLIPLEWYTLFYYRAPKSQPSWLNLLYLDHLTVAKDFH